MNIWGVHVGHHRRCGWMRARLGVWLAGGCLCLLIGQPVHAVVQVLPEMVLIGEGRTVTEAKVIRMDPTVQAVLAAFKQAERALQKQDLTSLMEFYASAYNYHGLHLAEVERIWREVFEHYRDLSSTHLFSEMRIIPGVDGPRVELTCTGGMYGMDLQSSERITLDSWFKEVHYLVHEKGGWRFLGNKGDAPRSAPFSSSPHHPLF